MDNTVAAVANGLIWSYRDGARKLRELAEQLSNEQFWTRAYPYGNSFGHLTLHLTGNLNYFIGAQIAGTGYVRDREREFTEGSPPAKEEALNRFDEAVEMVIATIGAQTAESWPESYQAVGNVDFIKDRYSILLRCATHLHHHLGQMIYLVKEFSR